MILEEVLLKKRPNMAAILKFKMAAEDAFEKNGTNSGFVRKGIRMQKILGSTSIGNFALDYITPCTIVSLPGPRFFYAAQPCHNVCNTNTVG